MQPFSKTLLLFFQALTVFFASSILAETADGEIPTDSPVVGLIDASFSVDANGAANYVVPLEVPTGTEGMEPSLRLGYNSQGGNGTLGVGWSLSGLSKIERCSATLAQDGFTCGINYDGHDRFCLDGERLVNIAVSPQTGTSCHDGADQDQYFDDDGTNVYHTERESWRRVVAATASCGQGPCGFTVTTKEGWTLEYGSPGDSSDPYGSRVLAYDAVDGDLLGVRVWALDKITDRNGNQLTITYTQNPLGGSDAYPCPVELENNSTSDPASPDYAPGKSLDSYVCRIDYTANAGTGLEARRHVVFGYEQRSDDAIVTYQGGGAITSVARTTEIRTQVADENDNLQDVKIYQLSYDSGEATRRSLLTELEECGTDGSCFSPTTLGFPSYPPSLSLSTVVTKSLPACGDGDLSWADFNGDGRLDWLCAATGSGTVYVALSTGSEFTLLGNLSVGIKCSGTGARVDWGDFDADGDDDWLCFIPGSSRGTTQVALSDGQSLSYLASATASNASTACSDDWLWTDFDANGFTDWVCGQRSGNLGQVFVLLSDGSRLTAPAGVGNDGTAWESSLASGCADLIWTDFDGDGLSDWMCNNAETGQVWALLSTGSSLRSATGSTTTPLGNQNARCAVNPQWTDVSGDGLSDWTCSDTDSSSDIYILLSTGTDLVSPVASQNGKINVSASCSESGGQQVTWSDFNSDGLRDWICSGDQGATVLLSGFQSDSQNASFVLSIPSGSSGGKISGAPACGADALTWGDFVGDGLSDWMCSTSANDSSAVSVSQAEFPYPDLVQEITNGFGGLHDVDYLPLTDSQIYSQTDGGLRLLNRMTNAGYPLENVQNAMYVVQDYRLTDTAAHYNYKYSYTYTDALTSLDGRGWMGFASITRTDEQLQSQATTSYLQEFPWNGQAVGQQITGCNAGVDLGCGTPQGELCDQVEYHFRQTSFYCQDLAEDCSTSPTFSPYPGVYQVLPTLKRDDYYNYGSYLFSLGQEYTLDAYGNRILTSNPNYVAQTWEGGDGSGNLFTDDDVYTAVTYYNRADESVDGTWLLGFPQGRVQCSALSSGTCDPNDAVTLLRQDRTNYDYPATDAGLSNGCLPDSSWTFAGTMNVLCEERYMDHAGTGTGTHGDCASDGTWLATTYLRDAYGHAVATTDPAGNTTSVAYESVYQTYPAQTTSPPDAQGTPLVTQTTYSPWFGTKLQETDPNGNLFAWCFDAFGRPTARQGPNASSADLAAEACPSGSSTTSPGDLLNLETYQWTVQDGDPTLITNERNDWPGDDWRTTAELRDGLNRISQKDVTGTDSTDTLRVDTVYLTPELTNSQTVPYYVGDTQYQSTTCYDSSGRHTRESEPYQASPTAAVTETVTTWAYSGDACGTQSESVAGSDEGAPGATACAPCGSTSYTGYPALLVTETQASESDNDAWKRELRQQFYDGRRGISAVTFLNNDAQTCFDHDRLGRPTGLTDAIGAVASVDFNSLDRPYATTDADLGARNLCYDSAGRPSVLGDAKQQARVRTYDGLNRVLRKDFYDTSGSLEQSHAFTFDDDGSGRANLMGRLSQVQSTYADASRNSSYDFSYDPYGRVGQRQLTFGPTYTTGFEHDPLGRPTSYTYPDNSTLVSAWSSLGFLQSETLSDIGGEAELALTYSSYSSLGRPEEIHYGSAVTEAFTYYPLGRLATRNLAGPNGTLLDDTWTWNPLGSLTDYTSLNGDETFGYDASASCNDDNSGNTRRLITYQGTPSYCYDGGGNRTQAGDVSYRYNPGTHQVAAATAGSPFQATYDANGNTATTIDPEGTSWTYTVDTRDRLIAADAGTVSTSSVYDYLGRRLRQTDDDETVTTYVSPRYVLSGSQTEKYLGDISRKRGAIVTDQDGDPAPWFYYLDQVDSVVLATDVEGAVSAQVTYDSWGNIDPQQSSNQDTLRYTYNSKEFDPDTGLYYFEARHYQPVIGRFVTADTRLGGRLTRQDSTNRYALVLNDPLSFSDPSGHSWYSRAWHEAKKAAKKAAHTELKIIETPYVQTAKFVRSTTGKVVMSAIIDGVEIGAGAAIMGMSFGGASTLSSTLIGAGVSGAEYTFTHRGSNFSWKQYGLAEASGAVSGLVSGGIGELGGGLISAESSTATRILAGAALGASKSAAGNVAGQVTTNLITGHSAFHKFNWTSFAISTGSGAVKGGVKGGVLPFLPSSSGTASGNVQPEEIEMADFGSE